MVPIEALINILNYHGHIISTADFKLNTTKSIRRCIRPSRKALNSRKNWTKPLKTLEVGYVRYSYLQTVSSSNILLY